MSFYSPNDILEHCREFIPRLSDRFGDNASITAEIITGTPQILRVTEAGHGFSAGKIVNLIDGKIDNPITAVVDNGDGTIRFTTESEHDLTEGFTTSIELVGFTLPIFNSTFPLESVPNRTTFEIESSSVPVLNGGEALREVWEIGVNGYQTLDSVTTNTYDILLTGKPIFTLGTVPEIKRVATFNMAVSVDAERARSLYTKQTDKNNLWLYVIMGDSAVSKDRTLKNDATIQNTAGQQKRPLNVNTFSIAVFFPTHDETAASEAVQLAYEEIYQLMLATMSGIRFDDFGNTQYLTAQTEHGAGQYTNAWYSHVYDFEYSFEITQDETSLVNFIESRAARDIGISFAEIQDGSDIDLDEEP